MKKLVLISAVLHLVLIAALAPLARTHLGFNPEKEAQRKIDVQKREAERKAEDHLQRARQKLAPEAARILQREAESQARQEIARQIQDLRNKRDAMMLRREDELKRLRSRSGAEILSREQAAIAESYRKIAVHIASAESISRRMNLIVGSFPDQPAGLLGILDDLKISRRIWSAEEIENEGAAPVAAENHWQFEGRVRDSGTGRQGELRNGGRIVERPDGLGKAFGGDGKAGLADLGPTDLDNRFTLSFWTFLENTGKQQVLLTNNDSQLRSEGIRLFIENDEGGAKVVFRTTGDQFHSADTATFPNSFRYGEWTHIVVTVDVDTQTAAIFINGKKADLARAEVAEGVSTGAPDLAALNGEISDVLEKIALAEPTADTAASLSAELEGVSGQIAAEISQVTNNNPVRSELESAAKEVSAARDALERLPSKMDPDAMNNTETAISEKSASEVVAGTSSASVAGIYDDARALERQIASANADIDAARQAISENTAYAAVRETALETTPPRPELGLSLQGDAPATVGELNAFRKNLHRAESEMRDMNARADALLDRKGPQIISASSFATGAAMTAAAKRTAHYGQVIDMTVFGDSGAQPALDDDPRTLQLDEDKIVRAAMPGRRFSESSLRKGWLYLDTWYVIGPWENNGIVDFSIKHPPESGIDFDARYYDGKFAERPGHPSEILKWQFYQSDEVRCQPPAVYAAATYYAYTDVWFEEARDMLVAVASDDASSVWLNGHLIWQDAGLSQWRLGEGYRKVRFNQGYNDVLIRIENGPKHCVWSVVLCPPETLGE